MPKLKVAIISNEDKIWSLLAWNNVFNHKQLLEDYDCAGFWTCDQKFSNKKKVETWTWYLKTFRPWNFFKLFCFVVSFKLTAFIKFVRGNYHTSFKKLAAANNIPYKHTSTPNDIDFVNWVKDNKIDVLLIMVDHILKKEIIAAPKLCIINKHAGYLPANKGLFPYFWAKLFNQVQGITFHKVNIKIDEGDLYYQEKVTDETVLHSMVSFYFYVYKNYYRMLNETLANLTAEKTTPLNTTITSSYYSLPTPNAYDNFNQKGGKIICWKDLTLPLTFLKN